MAKILFVDDRLGEVIRQWEYSGCASDHELLPLEPFDSIERTRQMVQALVPDMVLVGHGLGKSFRVTGSDVIRALRKEGYAGYIVANSGGGLELFSHDGVEVHDSANRKPDDLKRIVDVLLKGDIS